MPAPNEITPRQLLRLIGTPDCPAIVDISVDEDFDQDPFLIPSAFRHAYRDIDALIARLGGERCIIVCQRGLKLSQGLTSRLRGRGIPAEYLSGGNIGWREEPHAPRIPSAVLPASSLWVTRHRPKIDRIACPWLITRFINPGAEFLFVTPDSVDGAAERFGATAFDTKDAPFGHRDGHCTFDSLLDHFALRTTALDRMATVIRAADTGHLADAPQAAGLLALSLGLSRQHKDDHTQLAAAKPLYDAFYRWARDGADETHASFEDAS